MWSRWAALPDSTLVPFVAPAMKHDRVDTHTYTHTHARAHTRGPEKKECTSALCMVSSCEVDAAATMLSNPAGSLSFPLLQQEGLLMQARTPPHLLQS